ncbi:MAG: hypothetical protein ABSG25_01585 [Bryobacteraceae bacterium]
MTDAKIRYRMNKMKIPVKFVYDFWEFERVCFHIKNFYDNKEKKLRDAIIEEIEPKYFKHIKFNRKLRFLMNSPEVKKIFQKYFKKHLKLLYRIEEFEKLVGKNVICR